MRSLSFCYFFKLFQSKNYVGFNNKFIKRQTYTIKKEQHLQENSREKKQKDDSPAKKKKKKNKKNNKKSLFSAKWNSSLTKSSLKTKKLKSYETPNPDEKSKKQPL